MSAVWVCATVRHASYYVFEAPRSVHGLEEDQSVAVGVADVAMSATDSVGNIGMG